MPIWKVTADGPSRVGETGLKQEKILEQHLEDWIIADPSLLGERLFIIGRQVQVPEIRDRLDILALDPQGRAVVIELKRGHLRDPVDMQALRYASYLSKWQYGDFEARARNFLSGRKDDEFDFSEKFEEFCSDAGVPTVPDINEDQRIIIVGTSVREKLGSVALWLRAHSVDVTIIEVKAYKDGETIMVQPTTIVPVAVSQFSDLGGGRPEGTPWIVDGQDWHLKQRCSPRTAEMLVTLNGIIQENLEVDGPRWNQKFCVAYRIKNTIWLAVGTRSTMLLMDFNVRSRSARGLVKSLGINDYAQDRSGSSAEIMVNGNARIRIRAKDISLVRSAKFLEFLKSARDAFAK